MVKRQSETGQIRKEEMEVLDSNSSTMGQFESASKDVMSKRIIRRVNRKWKGSGRTGSAIQPPSAAMKPPAPANPFENTKLKAQATNKSMFAPKNTSSVFGNTFAGGVGSTVADKPGTAKSGEESTHSNIRITPLVTGAGENNVQLNKAEKLNFAMLRLAQLEWNRLHKTDWSSWLRNYVEDMEALQKECTGEKDGDEEEQSGPADKTGSSSNGETAGRDSEVTATFKPPLVSGQTGPAPSSTSTVFTPPTSSLTFGISSKAPAATPPAPFAGFSFGSFGAGSVAAAPAPPSSGPVVPSGKEVDDAMPKEEATKVLKVTNEEEEELFLSRGKYRKFMKEEKIWKDFSAGPLRLTRNKTTKKCGIVLRNEYGNVQLNLAVSKGMTFSKISNKRIGSVKFAAVQDSDVGFESFLLVVRPEQLDKLHETLEEMAK